jgi:alkanesulfonate monooxygenase SsuD/methylene tetrahydromethanopterin reductase-like flavin-dependent oxidoreductase (luciferase family)
MGYRNPAYLAKVAATIDHVSGGRIEMSIGGGWYEHEWRAYGYGFPRAGVRLGMLDEGVQIMQQAWRTGTATLAGKHYQVDGAIVRPVPLQDGGIPLWIAGGGEKVTLRIAAKYAQYTNFGGDLAAFAHKSEILAEHCREVGTDFDAITRSSNYSVLIGETQAEVDDKRAWLSDRLTRMLGEELAAQQMTGYQGTPAAGTVDQVVANLAALRDAGMTYAICYVPDAAYDARSLELLESQVIPALIG